MEKVRTQERLQKQELGHCEKISKLELSFVQQEKMLQEVGTRLEVVSDKISALRALVAASKQLTLEALMRYYTCGRRIPFMRSLQTYRQVAHVVRKEVRRVMHRIARPASVKVCTSRARADLQARYWRGGISYLAVVDSGGRV